MVLLVRELVSSVENGAHVIGIHVVLILNKHFFAISSHDVGESPLVLLLFVS